MCMQPRVVVSNSTLHTTTVNTNSKGSTGTSGVAKTTSKASVSGRLSQPILTSFVSTTTPTAAICSSSGGDIVDLVSDDEVEAVLAPVVLHRAHTTHSTHFTPHTHELNIQQNTTLLSNAANITNAHTHTTNTMSTTSFDTTIIKQHISHTYTDIIRTLSQLLQTPLSSNTTSPELSSALNIDIGSGEGEEEDDLILLGLLPAHTTNTACTTDIKPEPTTTFTTTPNQILTSNVRLSLEDLIPAPPFFVVTGRRTGDPASRKGKSKFCGECCGCLIVCVCDFCTLVILEAVCAVSMVCLYLVSKQCMHIPASLMTC